MSWTEVERPQTGFSEVRISVNNPIHFNESGVSFNEPGILFNGVAFQYGSTFSEVSRPETGWSEV